MDPRGCTVVATTTTNSIAKKPSKAWVERNSNGQINNKRIVKEDVDRGLNMRHSQGPAGSPGFSSETLYGLLDGFPSSSVL